MGKEKKREITVIPNTWIRESGVFDFHRLYEDMGSWFDSNNYEFRERAHGRAVKPEGNEIKLEWVAERKVDSYVKFNFSIVLEMFRYLEVKIQDKIYAKADLNFNIKAFFTKDYKKTFKGPFGEFLRELYEKYLIKGRLINFEGKLWAEGQEFINLMKESLDHCKR